MIELDFELTADDYVEASTAHPGGGPPPTPGLPNLLLCGGLTVILVLIAGQHAAAARAVWAAGGGPPTLPLPATFGAALAWVAWIAAPGALLVSFQYGAALRTAFGLFHAPYPEPPRPAKRVPASVALLTIGGCVGGLVGVMALAHSRPPALVVAVGMTAALVGWALGAVAAVMLPRRGWRRAWEAQPALHGRRRAQVSAVGVSETWPTGRQHYDWAGFAGYRETSNLFVLYPSPFSFVMLPKRGLPADVPAAKLGAILAYKLGPQPNLPARGFEPIMPAATSAGPPQASPTDPASPDATIPHTAPPTPPSTGAGRRPPLATGHAESAR